MTVFLLIVIWILFGLLVVVGRRGVQWRRAYFGVISRRCSICNSEDEPGSHAICKYCRDDRAGHCLTCGAPRRRPPQVDPIDKLLGRVPPAPNLDEVLGDLHVLDLQECPKAEVLDRFPYLAPQLEHWPHGGTT